MRRDQASPATILLAIAGITVSGSYWIVLQRLRLAAASVSLDLIEQASWLDFAISWHVSIAVLVGVLAVMVALRTKERVGILVLFVIAAAVLASAALNTSQALELRKDLGFPEPYKFVLWK